ncbi:MAG TPA: nucleotidyltransferase family protein [Myxococcales bacterium]|nr:nucleotidyltransferase family protein [Myxococcales bacterium]
MTLAHAASGIQVGALILAAGRSLRMGKENKLCLPVRGKAMLLYPVEAAMEAGLSPVRVVTGHESVRIRDLLADYPVEFVHNPLFAEGLSTSLRAGMTALDSGLDGVVVFLGDMPRVSAEHIRLLIENFDPSGDRPICAPVHGTQRGNPVLWPRDYFDSIRSLMGDSGARRLLQRNPSRVTLVNMPDDGVLFDVDSPEDGDPEAGHSL